MVRYIHQTDLREAGLLEPIFAQARDEYPSECCGLIVEEEGGALARIACDNLQDTMHASDPETFTRTSRTAYFIDARLIRRHADQLRCIYHSHPDHGAYFSDEDQMAAAPFGEPSFPGVSYLVVSVENGEIADSKMFVWSDTKEAFIPSESDA
jgi:adenylyltransferase/sulfurtransferase